MICPSSGVNGNKGCQLFMGLWEKIGRMINDFVRPVFSFYHLHVVYIIQGCTCIYPKYNHLWCLFDKRNYQMLNNLKFKHYVILQAMLWNASLIEGYTLGNKHQQGQKLWHLGSKMLEMRGYEITLVTLKNIHVEGKKKKKWLHCTSMLIRYRSYRGCFALKLPSRNNWF